MNGDLLFLRYRSLEAVNMFRKRILWWSS